MQDLSSGKIYNDTKGVPGFDAEVELPAGTGKLFRIYQQ
jgi:hypothetical protein